MAFSPTVKDIKCADFLLQSKQEEEEAGDPDKVDKKWLDAYANRTKFFQGMLLIGDANGVSSLMTSDIRTPFSRS